MFFAAQILRLNLRSVIWRIGVSFTLRSCSLRGRNHVFFFYNKNNLCVSHHIQRPPVFHCSSVFCCRTWHSALPLDVDSAIRWCSFFLFLGHDRYLFQQKVAVLGNLQMILANAVLWNSHHIHYLMLGRFFFLKLKFVKRLMSHIKM